MFVLDTDHLSVLEWADNSATRRLLQRLSRISPEEATTTIITFEEQAGLARLPLTSTNTGATS
jgi:hypothetical protein